MYTSDVPTDKIMAAKVGSLLTEHYDSSLALLISATLSLVAILHKSFFIRAVLQVIYVTWAGVICLICTHESKGAQRPRASVDISGKSRLPMLHMLCNASNIPKIALHYIGKDGAFVYSI